MSHKILKALIACEESQRVCSAFRDLGHEAYEWYEWSESKTGKMKRMPKWYADAWGLSPSERAKVRSKTFPGIAQAMGDQWSRYLIGKEVEPGV